MTETYPHLCQANHEHLAIPAITHIFQAFAQQNQLLLNAAGEGIYGVDTEGRATFVNPAAERILGWKADELLGENIHVAIHHSHTDGSDYCVQDCPIFAAFRDGTVRRVDDEVFWCRDGHAVPVEYALMVTGGIIAGSIALSLWKTRHDKEEPKPVL